VRVAKVPPRLEMVVSVETERDGATPPAPARSHPAVSPARLRQPSALTATSDEITTLGRQHAVRGDALATAEAFCALVRDRLSYGFGATDVNTTAAEALAAGMGVCQDHAHVMLALCRSVGIAARYVSGHLVGQGGTHAWTEVLVPGRAVPFDPCHGRRADDRYITVAVGRDYRDVPPTSGSYSGNARGSLTTSRLLESAPVAA
jgi:transglutaminase-like putative cysteine protease